MLQTLQKYGTNLTNMAKMGKLDPVIGREDVIECLIRILCLRRKLNACLIGDPGVGKTVIVEGLAMQIANGSCPKQLSQKKVFSIDTGRLVSGASCGAEVEERLIGIVNDVKMSQGAVILFFDDLHSLIGDNGRACYASNILKPYLARGDLRCIGATTWNDYKKHIEKQSALKRIFKIVTVSEPSPTETIEILKGLQEKYEIHHGVVYTNMALITAVELSKQHISDRYMPDKAIDLIDEAGALVHLHKKDHIVTEEEIRQVVSISKCNSVEKVSNEESNRLLEMEKTFQRCLIGQDEAVSAVSRALRRARVGIRDQDKPIANFLFTGPTGVGKTQLAKLLAVEYFGSKEALVRIDMSEYMEKYNVARLIGSPPGYIGHDNGGQLTEQVRQRPQSVVLFDEIEKAHVRVLNVLLQILDDGRLTDGKGETVDFTNTIVILTSNVGGKVIGYDYDEVKTEVDFQLAEFFAPELLNRIDEVIVFHSFQEAQVRSILDVMLVSFCKKMNIPIEISNNLKDKLLSEGFNPRYGARPLKRAITRLLEDPLAEKILDGSLSEGSKAIMDVDSDGEVIVHSQFL